MPSHATDDCAAEPGTVALEIAALGSGPDGVARHEGRVVFVPGVAPGDRIRARLVEERGTFARARVSHRCAPGPAYRDPPCPWIEACGGCPWQQVAYPAQLAAKERNVYEALTRIGRITPARPLPMRAAPDEWRYRRRMRLHVGPRGAIGSRRARSHEHVEIGDCLIADATLTAVLPVVRDVVRRLRTRIETIELLANGGGKVVVSAAASASFAAADAPLVEALLAAHGEIAGVHLAGHDWQRTWGDPTVRVAPDAAVTLSQRPGSFSQVNPAANQLLVASVVELARPATRVLDLFCGAGNLSLPLARTGSVVIGVDTSATAIADAQTSAARAGLDGARFEALPVLRFLRQQGLGGADLVVLDPPRAGAAEEIGQLARLRPRRIVYVSCDAATLARDASVLVAAGYTIDRVQPLDLFPQTPHVETVLEARVAID
jgi:23S rRNA (uracil1939-C5)-methyltransferase